MKTNNKPTKFVEDILAQDEFDPADLVDAKHKHPFLHWIQLNWKLQKLNWELELCMLVGKAKAVTSKLFKKH
jgi:hypothetical protein